MLLVVFAVVVVLPAVLIRRKVVPWLEKRVHHATGTQLLRRAALLGVGRYLASLLLFLALGGCTALASIAVVRLASSTSFQSTQRALDIAREARGALEHIHPVINVAIALWLVPVFCIVVYRSSKQKIVDRAADALLREIDAADAGGDTERFTAFRQSRRVEHVLDRLRTLRDDVERAASAGRLRHAARLRKRRRALSRRLVRFALAHEVTIALDVTDILPPPPTRVAARIATFFISEGLVRSMRAVSKTWVAVGMLLIVPSLIGVEMEGARTPVDVRVADLMLMRSTEEARGSFAKAKEDDEVDTSTVDDAVATQRIATYYEAAVRTPAAWKFPTAEVAVVDVRELQARDVRRSILETFAKHADGDATQIHAIGLAHDSAFVADSAAHALPDEAHLGAEGARIARLLEQIQRDQPSVWRRMKRAVTADMSDFVASFQRVAAKRDVQSVLAETAFEGIAQKSLHPEGTMSEVSAQMAALVGADTVDETLVSRELDYVAALTRGKRLQDAAEGAFRRSSGVAQFLINDGGVASEIERGITEVAHAPSLVAPPPAGVNMSTVQNALAKLRRAPKDVREARRLANVLADYEDYFAGSEAATRTPFAQLLHEWTGEVPRIDLVAAKAFRLLSGSPHVGGVLIGIPSSPPQEKLDFVDITWKVAAGSIEITMVRADGTAIVLGPFRTVIVAHALAYAADGRPTTVTIVNVPHVSAQKVLLHPALLDSALGCRAIALDHLVFDNPTFDTKPHMRTVKTLGTVYGLAVLERAIRAANAGSTVVVRDKAFAIRNDVLRELRATPSFAADLPLAGNVARSPLVAKPEYFDAEVVRDIVRCSGVADAAAFHRCLIRQPFARTVSDRMLALPSVEFVSGVRERAYAPDPDLSFLMMKSEPPLWPLDFMLATVFSTPPRFGVRASEVVSDPSPWTFPALHDDINRAVATMVANDPAACAVLRDLREFTIVQRLIRTALSGDLGPTFPTAKLSMLAQEVSSAMGPHVATARWEDVKNADVKNARDTSKELRTALRVKEGLVDHGVCQEIRGRTILGTACGH